jgi:hypothetical protein
MRFNKEEDTQHIEYDLTWDQIWEDFKKSEVYEVTLAQNLMSAFWQWLTENKIKYGIQYKI